MSNPSSEPLYPRRGQPVTLVCVRGAQVHVATARVTRVGDTPPIVCVGDPANRVEDGARVVVHYLRGENAWRARGKATREGDVACIALVAPPAPTEHRDFIRATLELPVAVRRIGRPRDLAEARAEQERWDVSPGDASAWTTRSVDLSAGGARFDTPELLRKHDVIDVRFLLPGEPGADAQEPRLVTLLGEALRVRQRPDGTREAAVRFLDVDETTQDLLFDAVAARYFSAVQGRLTP